LYPWIRPRTSASANRDGSTEAARQVLPVILFKVNQAGAEQLPPGYDNHIESRRDLVSTENLSNQSFGSIPIDRPAELARGGNTKPTDGPQVGQGEERTVATVDLAPTFVNKLEVGPPADALVLRQSSGQPVLGLFAVQA
jgi:hypothetical protein